MITQEYDYTHPLLGDGYLRFQFNEDGQLEGFRVYAELSEELLIKMVMKLPVNVEGLAYWKSRPSGNLTEYKREITFDDFYNRFSRSGGQKRNRYRAEKIWNKVSRLDQLRAYNYIPKYFMSLQKGINPKYADSYLDYRVWND